MVYTLSDVERNKKLEQRPIWSKEQKEQQIREEGYDGNLVMDKEDNSGKLPLVNHGEGDCLLFLTD